MIALNLIALILLWIGYCWLWVAFVNRFHSFKVEHRWLDASEVVHWAGLVCGPLFIFYGLGFRTPGILAGQWWTNVTVSSLLFMGICLVGLTGFVIQIIGFWFRHPHSLKYVTKSEIIDLGDKLEDRVYHQTDGKIPAGVWKTKLPGNQVFQVEINEKHLSCPGLPGDFVGPRILHLSDFHFIGLTGKDFFLEAIDRANALNPDIAVFSGDLIDNMELLPWIEEVLGRLTSTTAKYFILGNHDWLFTKPDQLRPLLEHLGWTDLAGQTAELDWGGMTVEFGGSELPWMGEQPPFATDKNEQSLRIFVCHTPDYIDWAVQHSVDLMLSGHTHGGQIRLPLLGPMYAPSRFGVRYASGVFHKSNTTMHVSRGLSAMIPVRWNCRPEITCVVPVGSATR